MTTRGIKEEETKQIVEYIDQALKSKENEDILADLRIRVREMSLSFPVPKVFE
jgi:glycine/serine hydroxymethyltransferase